MSNYKEQEIIRDLLEHITDYSHKWLSDAFANKPQHNYSLERTRETLTITVKDYSVGEIETIRLTYKSHLGQLVVDEESGSNVIIPFRDTTTYRIKMDDEELMFSPEDSQMWVSRFIFVNGIIETMKRFGSRDSV